MASDRHSRPRGAGERRHKSSRSASRHHATSSDGALPGHSSHQALSQDALAAHDGAKARGVSSRYAEENLEEEDPERIRRRRERRERRNREQRTRAGRDGYREVDSESPRTRQHRESRSQPPPPPPPAYDEMDAGSDYHHERRERRRQRASRAYESPRERESYPNEVRDGDRGRRKERKRKTRVAVGTAATEEALPESRDLWQQMRGGGTNPSTSYDSFDSKEAYDEEPQKKGFWTKKKICKYFTCTCVFDKLWLTPPQ